MMHASMRQIISALAIPVLLLTGCDSAISETVCPAVITPAIEVEVRDAETGAPEAEGAVAVATDGTYTDTLEAAGSREYQGELVLFSLAGANERPGTYDVVVEKQGFETWTRTGVEPDVGECGVQTEVLDADLVPESTANAGR